MSEGYMRIICTIFTILKLFPKQSENFRKLEEKMKTEAHVSVNHHFID